MLGWSQKAQLPLAAAAVASVVSLAPVVAQAPDTAASAAAAYTSAPTSFEDRIVYWTNVKRKRHGRRPLEKRECIDRYAESWARHLAGAGRFHHQDVTRMFECRGVRVAGENLARGRMSARRTVNAWMASGAHRRNLLKRRYTHIGVGSYYSGADGRLYTSQTLSGR